MEIHNFLSGEIVKFILVLVFSLIIGMEQRRHHLSENESLLFGTDRTFTFIGLLGYILFVADQKTFIPFLVGFMLIGIFLGIQYHHKIAKQNNYGLTSSILALLTYCLALMIYTQPVWLVLFFVVVILILTEIKTGLLNLTKKASEEEFITLAKFILFTGVILPLLPDKNISDQIPVSPYNIWLAVVVVSGISYVSYLLKKFVFPGSGLLLTGVLGGLYSSTATTLILARREKQGLAGEQAIPAIMIANGMMYLRILFLAFIFKPTIAQLLIVPFLILFAFCIILSKFISLRSAPESNNEFKEAGKTEINKISTDPKNPLELRTAVLFGVLFVIFGLITEYVTKNYGSSGITGLAFVVGVADIDPFLLNLLQQKAVFSGMIIVLAFINATNSNNILKMIYASTICSKTTRKKLVSSFLVLISAGLLISIYYYALVI
jgi:uncharacterized membrane protein (DUF4010 family)